MMSGLGRLSYQFVDFPRDGQLVVGFAQNQSLIEELKKN